MERSTTHPKPPSPLDRQHRGTPGTAGDASRGYNFVDGNDELGRLNAGLFAIAFVNDPGNFEKVCVNMVRDDMFVEYLRTVSTAVFIVPPGIEEGQYVGEALFAATS